jgi:hypothetical protein
MSNIEEELSSIKKDLDRIDLELAMNAEAIESIDMSLRFLQAELDYDLRGGSSAG